MISKSEGMGMRKTFGILLLGLSVTVHAESGLPSQDIEFIGALQSLRQPDVLARLGQPANVFEVIDQQGKVRSTIWRYEGLNTTADGSVYRFTDIDFVGDRIKDVMFSNSPPEQAREERDTPREVCPSEGCHAEPLMPEPGASG